MNAINRWLLGATMVAGVAGCMSTGPGEATEGEVIVSDTTVAVEEPGSPSSIFATLTIRIRNTGEGTIIYHGCGNTLQRIENGKPFTVWNAGCVVMDEPWIEIEPGEQHEERVDVGRISGSVEMDEWTEGGTGEYHLITNLWDKEDDRALPLDMQTSNLFQLRKP